MLIKTSKAEEIREYYIELEDIFKDYLKYQNKLKNDKLLELENKLKQYKILIEQKTEETSHSEKIEHFSNSNSSGEYDKSTKTNDMIDLIILIIIGLLIIFVMNSVFTIGKTIGMRKKIE